MRHHLPLLLLVALLLIAVPVWADGSQNPGVNEYNALKGLLTGSIGFGVAMLCAASGCYMWLVKQETGPGLTLLIIGATIALLPQFMDAMHVNLCPLVTDLGGTCATQSFVTGQ